MENKNIMTAPAIEVTLPVSGWKVSFKKWLSQKETDACQAPLQEAEIVLAGDGSARQVYKPEVLKRCERLLIETAVTIFNGETQNILEYCMELPQNDFAFLKAAIDQEYAKKEQSAT